MDTIESKSAEIKLHLTNEKIDQLKKCVKDLYIKRLVPPIDYIIIDPSWRTIQEITDPIIIKYNNVLVIVRYIKSSAQFEVLNYPIGEIVFNSLRFESSLIKINIDESKIPLGDLIKAEDSNELIVRIPNNSSSNDLISIKELVEMIVFPDLKEKYIAEQKKKIKDESHLIETESNNFRIILGADIKGAVSNENEYITDEDTIHLLKKIKSNYSTKNNETKFNEKIIKKFHFECMGDPKKFLIYSLENNFKTWTFDYLEEFYLSTLNEIWPSALEHQNQLIST